MNRLKSLFIFITIMLAISSLSVCTAEAQQVAHGVVYEDHNRNNLKDKNEPGIANVSVSNERNVVQTDSLGRYQLPMDQRSIIFISKPAGYNVPTNNNNLPQFYYIHYPEGTPDSFDIKYPTITPTGPLPNIVNFPLIQTNKNNRFTALAFADPQADNPKQVGYNRDEVIDELVGTDATFGLVAGDITGEAFPLLPRHNRLFGQIGIPIWNVPGNHDAISVPTDEYTLETFKHYFGPPNYSFNYGNVHFIALDNVQFKGKGRAYDTGRSYRGYLSKKQLDWVAQDLRFVPEDKLIVIITHIPLRTYAGGGSGINTVNLKELFDILRDYKVYSLSGHDTSNSWQVYLGKKDGWQGKGIFHHQVLAEMVAARRDGPKDMRGIPAGILEDGNPLGYYFLNFDRNDYTVRFKPAGHPAEDHIRIMFEPWSESGIWPSIGKGHLKRFVVNVFDGGSKTKVTCRIDGHNKMVMKRTLRADPLVERFAGAKNEQSSKDVDVSRSSHIWQVDLPDTLRDGAHTITVKARDQYGHIYQKSAIFEIQKERSK